MKILFICFLIFYLLNHCLAEPEVFTPIGLIYENGGITYQYTKEMPENYWIFGDLNKSPNKFTILYFYNHINVYQNYLQTAKFNNSEKNFILDKNFKMCKNDPIKTSDCNPFTIIPKYYPQPQNVKFNPGTRGGIEFIQGDYLHFGSKDNKFRYTTYRDNVVQNATIINYDSDDFDATNIQINYPGGCGTSFIRWFNSDQLYGYQHARAYIQYVLFDKFNRINIVGNNLCDYRDIKQILVRLNNIDRKVLSVDHELLILEYDESILKINQPVLIFIFHYGERSTELTFTPYSNLTIIPNVSFPSVNGQTIEYQLHGIKIENLNYNSNFTWVHKNYTIHSQLESNDKNVKTFKIEIPKGCGRIDINSSIADQNVVYTHYYDTVKLSRCRIIGTVETNGTIECLGNFEPFIQYYLDNNDFIQFSNIEPSPVFQFTNYNTSISFPLKSQYTTIQLLICNQPMFTLNIPPKLIDSPINKTFTFNSKGGIITLIGYHFNQDSINNTYFICNNDDGVTNGTFKVNCLYESYSSSICPFNITGPNDIKCNFTFNGGNDKFGDSNNQLTIKFLGPKLLNITNQINLKDGGIITIIGNEFYNNTIGNITIGDRICINTIYFNDTTLTCYLPPFEHPVIQYVKITTDNGKNDGIDLLIYKKLINENIGSSSSSRSSESSSSSSSSTTITTSSNNEISNEISNEIISPNPQNNETSSQPNIKSSFFEMILLSFSILFVLV